MVGGSDKTRQRSKSRDTRCNLFMEAARSVNNSVDIWSLTYLVRTQRSSHGTCQKEVQGRSYLKLSQGVVAGIKSYLKLSQGEGAVIKSYRNQMDISDYSVSPTATPPNDEQS